MKPVISEIIAPRAKDLGGFEVRRLLPSHPRKLIGPFIFWDHMGPATFAPGQGIDVRPHPHIGLATVTYLFEGAILHRDSVGSVQEIRPGDVNWMTAGKGIVHSERTPPAPRAQGSKLNGIQTWLALPTAFEEAEPRFAHHPASTLPLLTREGWQARVIAGRAFGVRAPVQTFADVLYVAVEMSAGSRLLLQPEHEERAAYLLSGTVSVGDSELPREHIAVLPERAVIELHAQSPARLMLLGGDKLEGDRVVWWNFVSSSRERIELAKRDWREGRFAPVPGESEFIPLPSD